MALVLTRRFGQSIVLKYASGDEARVRIEQGRQDGEVSLVIEAQQSLEIFRPECLRGGEWRSRKSGGCEE